MTLRSSLGPVALSALIPAAMALIYIPFTPQVAGVGGPTSDGIRYAAVVAVLRDGASVATEAPYVHRILPAAIVAALPLGTRDGFLLLNGLATLLTGPLLYALLRRSGAARATALVGVAWWAVLPATVRYTVHYPTTLDAIGLALLAALLLLTQAKRVLAFAALLSAAAVVRENALAVAGVLLIRLLPEGRARALRRTSAAVLPAALLFAWVHIWPPVAPTMWWTQYDLVLLHLHELLFRPEVGARLVATVPLSLGLLVVVPLATWRASGAFLHARPEWTYYIVVTLGLAVVGGLDYDRFMVWLVPALAVLTFCASPRVWSDARVAALLTALHVVAVRWLWPIDTDGHELLVVSMDGAYLALVAATVAVAAVGAWLVLRRVSGPTPVAVAAATLRATRPE